MTKEDLRGIETFLKDHFIQSKLTKLITRKKLLNMKGSGKKTLLMSKDNKRGGIKKAVDNIAFNERKNKKRRGIMKKEYNHWHCI